MTESQSGLYQSQDTSHTKKGQFPSTYRVSGASIRPTRPLIVSRLFLKLPLRGRAEYELTSESREGEWRIYRFPRTKMCSADPVVPAYLRREFQNGYGNSWFPRPAWRKIPGIVYFPWRAKRAWVCVKTETARKNRPGATGCRCSAFGESRDVAHRSALC